MQNDVLEHISALKDYISRLLTTMRKLEQLPTPYNIWVGGAKTHDPCLKFALRNLEKVTEDINLAEEFITHFYDCQKTRFQPDFISELMAFIEEINAVPPGCKPMKNNDVEFESTATKQNIENLKKCIFNKTLEQIIKIPDVDMAGFWFNELLDARNSLASLMWHMETINEIVNSAKL